MLRRAATTVAVLAVLAGVAAGAYYAFAGGGTTETVARGATAVVRQGELRVTVDEHGTVEADKRIVINNKLRWPVIIEEVVEDGSVVEANQVIVRFSCSDLEEAMRKHELTLRSSRSDYEQATANLELKRQEVAEKIRKAVQAVRDANDDRTRYLEGEWPIQKREQEEEIRLKEWELKIAQEALDFKIDAGKRLGAKSPYTDSEIESDRLSLDRKKLNLQKLRAKFDMLVRYDHPKQQRKYDNAVRDAELALQRCKVDGDIELHKSEELVQTRKETLARHEKEMERLKEDETNLVVQAERRGLVVYDTRRNRWDNNNVAVAVGEKIQPGQQLMMIPDMTTLQIRTKVFESMYKWVKPNLPATVRLETDPHTPLPARVIKISPLPERSRWWSAGVTYKVLVELDKAPKGLKPNMTAKVTLELARLEDVICVPVAAVFSEGERTYCYLVEGGGQRKVEVEVGKLSNDREVQVLKGLEPGQRVMLIEPPGEAGSDEDLPEESEPDASLPGMAG